MARPKIKDSVTQSFSIPRKIQEQIEPLVKKAGGWSKIITDLLAEKYAIDEEDSPRKKLARDLSTVQSTLKKLKAEEEGILELLK